MVECLFRYSFPLRFDAYSENALISVRPYNIEDYRKNEADRRFIILHKPAVDFLYKKWYNKSIRLYNKTTNLKGGRYLCQSGKTFVF